MPIAMFWLNALAPRDVPGYAKVLSTGAHAVTLLLAVFWLGMPIVSAAAADRPAAPAEVAAQNCLLPAQIHRVGSITMVMPRRAVALPAAECVARGGEPIASAASS
jgi:hypothetical protein